MTLDPNTHMLLVDTETTGLEPESCQLIEVGFMIVDLHLNVVDKIESVIIPEKPIDWGAVPEFVRKMHEKSGLRYLVDDAKGVTLDVAEAQFVDWYALRFGAEKMPLCGSTVQFDRNFLAAFMPQLSSMFHYRNQDISSVKELCRIFNPEVAGAIKEGKIAPSRGVHRVMPDLEDSIEELRAYLDEFLIITRPWL